MILASHGDAAQRPLDGVRVQRDLRIREEADESGWTARKVRSYSVVWGQVTFRVGDRLPKLIESAKLCSVEPRACLREAALRAVRNPGTVTLARELKSSES